jgi:predicted molibdopterin-dependent oxidoreductase YjgC
MDITLSSQMLLDPADTVVLLPALTRYEIDGGVTETSTERRVIYSPRIRGKRPPDARSEGEVLGEIAARVKPQLADKVRFTSTRAIRAEIAQVIPQYTGIETLEREGDQFQYGGSLLCKDWQFPTPDGKAHFYAAPLPDQTLASDEFILVTRRGKQFNSMVHEDKEGATGYGRDAVLISAADARRLGLAQGESVQLSNDVGSYVGRVQIADLATGMVQVYWPEANTLLDSGTRSPKATVPAYKGGRVKLSHAAQAESAASAIKV